MTEPTQLETALAPMVGGNDGLAEVAAEAAADYRRKFDPKVFTVEQLVAIGHTAREHLRQFEAERDQIAKPLRAIAAKQSKRWKAPIQDMGWIVAGARAEIEARRELERAEQTAALTAATSAQEVAEAVTALAPRPDGLTEREEWVAEIVVEQMIPREFWELQENKLHALARKMKDAFNVPGVRAVRRTKAVFR